MLDLKKLQFKGDTAKRLKMWQKNPHCYWCKKWISFEEATIEHVQPRSLGGKNNKKNLKLACRPCNGNRGNNKYWQVGEASAKCYICGKVQKTKAYTNEAAKLLLKADGWHRWRGYTVCSKCCEQVKHLPLFEEFY